MPRVITIKSFIPLAAPKIISPYCGAFASFVIAEGKGEYFLLSREHLLCPNLNLAGVPLSLYNNLRLVHQYRFQSIHSQKNIFEIIIDLLKQSAEQLIGILICMSQD